MSDFPNRENDILEDLRVARELADKALEDEQNENEKDNDNDTPSKRQRTEEVDSITLATEEEDVSDSDSQNPKKEWLKPNTNRSTRVGEEFQADIPEFFNTTTDN